MANPLKQFMPAVINSAAFTSLVGLLEQTGSEQSDLLRVLTYHRVDEPEAHPWLEPGLISASPAAFEAQMKYLSENYQPISVLDVLNAFENPAPNGLPARAVLITFDDAYCDFEEYAWPVLKKYRIPVTLFVPTAFPDHPERYFWWDALYHALHTTDQGQVETPLGQMSIVIDAQRSQVYAQLRDHIKTLPSDEATALVEKICDDLGVAAHANYVLGWEALRRLAQEGVTLGAHTRTHPIMNHITPGAMRQEVAASMDDLQREIGITPSVFAYPSGFHNQEVVEAVKSAGIKLAFTTERGINTLSKADPLQLQRINVGFRTTIPMLRAQLLSWSAPLYPIGKKVFS